MTALHHLNTLADQRKAEKWPNVPSQARVRSNYRDKSANGLTACIVDFLNFSGHFATRLQSTGQYRDDLKKWVASQQRAGLPDVLAIVEGRALFVEIKAGKDRLSDVQKETHTALQQAGAWVYVARSFQDFYDFFTALSATLASQ